MYSLNNIYNRSVTSTHRVLFTPSGTFNVIVFSKSSISARSIRPENVPMSDTDALESVRFRGPRRCTSENCLVNRACREIAFDEIVRGFKLPAV